MDKKILVVDNHPLILKFMKDLLEKEGHHVSTAEDGLSALDVLKNYKPDVVFIDLIMPNISGEKLCRIVRGMQGAEDVYIIILSAIAAEQAIPFEEFGANACIAKGPLDQMAQNILSVLDRLGREKKKSRPENVLGLEGVNPRHITKELLIFERHSQAILNAISEGILEITPESRVVYANPVAMSLFGLPEEKVLGSPITELFQPLARPQVQELMRRTEINATQEIDPDESTVGLNGREVSIKMCPIEDGDVKGNIMILEDVTDRKRMEAQLQLAQKIEAIATLASGIAHDFNNLLMAIQGNVSVMLLDVDPMHPHHKRLKNTEKQVQNGAKLTRQLLGYVRKGEHEVKPMNLNQSVKETAETIGRTRKDIRIHLNICEDLLNIKADEGQIQQVLLNLFVNAVDAMPEGGQLILKTMNIDYQDIKSIMYAPKPGNYVQLSITDTGTGMDRATRERIFDPFFTTKEKGRGTGLGLSSSYRIIKSHGGVIDVVSKEGKGTTFNIYLPALKTCGSKLVKTEEQMSIDIGTVLFVDDEPMVLDSGVRMLQRLGYTVFEAKGGREAIDVYKKNGGHIDVVILDMIMPEMGGGEVFDRMKQMNPDIKVLLSSGYSIDGQASQIVERGCNGFLQKPFRLRDLSEKIKDIMHT